MKQTKSTDPIQLSELIDYLRADLLKSAADRPADWQPMFDIDQATIEVAIDFERSVEASGGLSIYVAKIGAKGNEKATASHKICLTLKAAPASSKIVDGMLVESAETKALKRGAK